MEDMGRARRTPGSGTLETPHGRGELAWGPAKTAGPPTPRTEPPTASCKMFLRLLIIFLPSSSFLVVILVLH